MTDRFLGTSSSNTNLSNGSANLYINSATIESINPGMPVKTNSVSQLVGQNLEIGEINGLQTALNNTLQNPFNGTLEVVDLKTQYNTTPILLNTFISSTNGKIQNFTAVAGTTSFGNTDIDGANIITSSINTTGRCNFIQVASMGTPSAGRSILWANTSDKRLYVNTDTPETQQLTISTDLNAYLTTASASSTYLTQANATSTYLTQANASSTYLTQANATSTYLTQASATSTYLTQANATSTYLTQANASSTYLTQASATSTYLTQANATSIYLTQSNASSTYLPLAGGTITGALNSQSIVPTTSSLYSLGSGTFQFARLWVRELDSSIGSAITLGTNTLTSLAPTQTLTASTVINLNSPSVLKNGIALATATDLTAKVSRDGTLAMTGALDAGSFKILNVATPTLGTDAVNKTYSDLNVPKAGGVVITGGLDTSDLNPRTNATYSLGTDTFRYLNLKMTGLISNANGASINFAGTNTLAITATTATLNGSALSTATNLGTKLSLDGTLPMTGQLNMNSQKIINLATPTIGTDAVNKTYADLMLPLAGGTMTGDIVVPNAGATNPVITPLGNLTTGLTFNSTVAGFASNGRAAFQAVSNPALGVGSEVGIGTNIDAYSNIIFSNTAQVFSISNASASTTFALIKGSPFTGTPLVAHNSTTNITTLGDTLSAPTIEINSGITNANSTTINLLPTGDLQLGGTAYLANPQYFSAGQQGVATTIPLPANALQSIAVGPYTSSGLGFSISNSGIITYLGARTRLFRVSMLVNFAVQSSVLATMTFYLNKGTVVAPVATQPKYIHQVASNSETAITKTAEVSQIFSLAQNETVVGVVRSNLAQLGTGATITGQHLTVVSLLN